MRKNKLILFDWGNIVESNYTKYTIFDAFDDLFKDLGSSEKDIFFKLGKYKLAQIGTMDEFKKAYLEMKNDFNLNADFDEFKLKYEYYFDKIYYYKDVRDYEISLKEKCYIGVLSNLLLIDEKRIDKQLGLNNYDYVFLSFKYGMKKPNIEFYETIQKELPFKKEDILFLDDKESNVETAKKIGWNSYVVTGLELDKIKKICEDFVK